MYVVAGLKFVEAGTVEGENVLNDGGARTVCLTGLNCGGGLTGCVEGLKAGLVGGLGSLLFC